ncbi:MAG TPA: DUF4390 domain-containing protein [Burkholderiales bacterium]|nr:DUF4390 domain-containing protein [Burkholderiales bacterium]
MRSALSWLLAAWLALTALAGFGQGIEIRKPTVTVEDGAIQIDAQFDIQLTPTLEDALNKGVPLYFALDFELIRPRWYWFNDRVLALHQQYRLSFNALTRQYRLGVGNLYQNYATVGEALEVMSRFRRRVEVDPGAVRRDAQYIAALRLRLDTSQLPKPFQVSALGSSQWQVSSDWYRWTVGP